MVEIRCGQDENVPRKDIYAGVRINNLFLLLNIPLSEVLPE